MKTQIFIIACIFMSAIAFGQSKDALFMVNEKQKKIFANSGQSANKAWYTIYEKTKDTVLVKTQVIEKNKFDAVVDSLKKDGFAAKFKKEKVSDLKVSPKIIEHKFFKIDTVKKASGKFTADSIFVVKIMVNINSEKEKINKNRSYDQKYTSLNKSKFEEKLKKHKDFSLIKYANADLYEFNLIFNKLSLLNPESFYSSFESGEREFF